MTVEEILEALRAIVDAAGENDLTDEEAARYEELEGQLAVARRNVEIRARQTAYDTVPAGNVHVGTAPEDDTLDRAFSHYMRTGVANQDITELRAQGVGTDAAGGFTVPTGFRNKLVERMVAFGGLANEVEVITTENGADLPWPTLDDTANEGEIAAEGAGGAGGADLVFGEISLGAFKYVAPGVGAAPLRVSVELLQDSAFDIEALVARKLGERIARTQAVDWVRGVGTTEPFGITTSSGAAATFAGAAPTKDELIDALHSVDPDYRGNAVWGFNDTSLSLVRKLEDTTGRPLLQPFSGSGVGGDIGGMEILGHRVVIDQAFADYTDASGNEWGVFGDVREGYVIRRVRDITLIVNPYSRANEGQVEYTVWARADGVVQNPNAFSLLSNDAV